jgi:hypothetical protein
VAHSFGKSQSHPRTWQSLDLAVNMASPWPCPCPRVVRFRGPGVAANCPRPGNVPAQSAAFTGPRESRELSRTLDCRRQIGGLVRSAFSPRFAATLVTRGMQVTSSFDPASVRQAVAEFTPRRPQRFQELSPAREVMVELRHNSELSSHSGANVVRLNRKFDFVSPVVASRSSSPCSPSAVHLDPPPGSGSRHLGFRTREIFTQGLNPAKELG